MRESLSRRGDIIRIYSKLTRTYQLIEKAATALVLMAAPSRRCFVSSTQKITHLSRSYPKSSCPRRSYCSRPNRNYFRNADKSNYPGPTVAPLFSFEERIFAAGSFHQLKIKQTIKLILRNVIVITSFASLSMINFQNQ